MIVAFRRHRLLPLDERLYVLQPSIPHLTRSSRCLRRHGISRLRDVDGDKPKRQKFKRDPIHWPTGDLHGYLPREGFFHIDIAGQWTQASSSQIFWMPVTLHAD